MGSISKTEISDILESYISKFNNNDLAGAASYYDEPAVIISAEGVKLMPAQKDYVSTFTETVKRLKSEGWDHSEFIGEKGIAVLDGDKGLVLASCPCKRLRKDGSSVEEFTATYTLRKKQADEGEGWLIASIHHGPFGTVLKS